MLEAFGYNAQAFQSCIFDSDIALCHGSKANKAAHFDHVGQTARLQSASQIVRWLSAQRAGGETVILTGDLNTEPGTPPIQELTSSALGLRDTYKASQTPHVGPDGTFNAFVLVPSESRRIDYILASPSIAVENYAVLAWHGEGGRPASDHFPVIADLNPCGK